MTATNTQTQSPTFAEASAKVLPTLFCVGTVGEVSEANVSKSGQYIVQPIKINALGAGKNMTKYLLWRPEWLRAGFKPDSLKQIEGGNSAHFVYSNNINVRGGISALRGLAGSDEAFDQLAGQLLSLPNADDQTEGPSMEDVTTTLSGFFANNMTESGEPVQVGYVLCQQQTKTDELDENGKAIKIMENRYDIKEFFDPTPKALAAKTKSAENSNGRSRMTYTGEPF